ncbi:MAG TPA: hypothetical protein VEQ60_11285 [Longimicrobium sp.]|nr:hypothetical protein [Longimicrobium sp.]
MTAASGNPAESPAEALPAVPYRGIEAFRLVDEDLLFARENDSRRLIRSVTVYRGVLLYGDSGVGKSSIVNAGLLPEAIREGLAPERLRVQPLEGKEIVVERISLGGDDQPPFLPSIFAEGEGQSARPSLSTDEFLRRLRALPPNVEPLLVFDQFEELYTLFEEAPAPGEAAAARQAQERVIDALAEVLNDRALPIKLVFSFREEYLPKLSKLFQRHPSLPDQAVRITPPEIKAVEDIIAGPLRTFPERYGGRFSEALVERLVGAFHERFRDQPVNLSEVQIACWQLWRSADPSAAFQEKGLRGLQEDFFVEQMETIPKEDRVLAIALLAQMITPSGARNFVSRDHVISLVQRDTSADAERIGRVLSVLDRDTKLVRRELRQNVTYYTIVSEFLVDWIRRRDQERVREWERMLADRRLAEERAEADRRLEVERARAAKLKVRILTGGLATAVVIIGALGLLVAELRTQRAELTRNEQRLRAQRDSLNDALGGFLVLQQALQNNNRAAATDTAAAEVVPLMYIHFQGDITRGLVEEFRAELNQAGFVAPGSERVERVFSNGVRYFHLSDAPLADTLARRATTFFRDRGCPIVIARRYIPGLTERAAPGQVEIWISHSCRQAGARGPAPAASP